jgi:putative nucleotidyltransferase with HDIG domain/diguanylate cyclase (GGDEF)-like protein
MSATRPTLNGAGQLYVGLVALVGSGVVVHSLHTLATASIQLEWFVLAGLTLLSGSFTIRVPTIPARLSVSETFVFAAAILFGPPAATIIVVLDTLIISLWLRRASRLLSRVLFNMSAPAIAIWVASHAFFIVADIEPLSVTARPILSLVAPLLLLALIYFLLNSWLIAIAVGFEQNTSPAFVWRRNFLWLSLNYFSGASVAALLLPYLQDVQQGFIQVAGMLLPLLVISYLTFKTALGRVEDANRHLVELNKLYLSTIETLAMAIDAKDQITHGHIRRVQNHAVKLATEMGVRDTDLIRAIEAAALLHDMGKLAVPEYILNKPGPLTPAEFERMKLHASAGADILSAIEFPYPVVPIVRHHHENWDGSGYPDGLSGADIPIGARILSVVDCFDALTSDRPYRPRLSDKDALNILLNRRGTMYDPLAVDAFIRLHAEAVAEPESAHTTFMHETTHVTRTPHTLSSVRLDDISEKAEETFVILSLARALSSAKNIEDTAAQITSHVRRLIPCSLVVLYVYDSHKDALKAFSGAGDNADFVSGLTIPMGERLSGWVAANRMPIANSDPILDFGESVRRMTPRPRSCMSTPIILANKLVGVLSLYSPTRDSFTNEHQRLAETIVKHAALAVRQQNDLHRAQRSPQDDPVTGLPYFLSTQRQTHALPGEADSEKPFSLLLLHVQNREQHDQTEQRHDQEDLLHTIARVARRSLRSGDMLFRHGATDFVALLLQTDRPTATEVGERLLEAVSLERRAMQHGAGIHVSLSVSSAPQDGRFAADLLNVALERQSPRTDNAKVIVNGRPSASVH